MTGIRASKCIKSVFLYTFNELMTENLTYT